MKSKTEALKILLGEESGYFNVFYEVLDCLVVDSLKEHIVDLTKSEDIHETPDNKLALLSSMYRVLQYYTAPDEYKGFVREMQSETSN